MQQFETLRVNAALCLYTTYPLFSIPVLSWAVTHTSLAISSRLEVVAILVRGAYLLSGVSEPGTERDLTKDTAKVNEVNDSNPSRALGTTRVKRPKKLEIMKRKVIYTRNHFGSVAEAVFTPVSSIVAALLAADTRAAVTSNSDIALTDVLRYQKGGITEIPAFSIEPPQTSKRLHDIEDGIDLLLPSQCMLALACFVRCSINSICQRLDN